MDAVIIAGGIPQEGEPLYEYTQGASKAMLDIAGKPMVQWVLDALNGAAEIDKVVIVGLSEEEGLESDKITAFVPNMGDLIANVRAGVIKTLEINPQTNHVIVVSSDIPAISSEMVDWLVNASKGSDLDLYYTVIERQVMEKRFPTSKRSYVRLKDVEVCGGDVNIIHASLAASDSDIWDRLLDSRKNAVKQAAIIGFDTLLLMLLHAVTIDRAVEKVAKRLKITGKAVLCPFAEVGMDVDKPNQLDILRDDIALKSSG
jgi:molybdopterin-guanine dinucleotide biosynthesis protein A